MERNPIQNDARRAAREDRLGPDAVCVLCCVSELALLVPVKRRLLEHHHVVGRAHDEASTLPVCRNCHARLTEALEQVGADMKPQDTVIEKLISVLRALGAFFETLAEACFRWAEELVDLLRQLDSKVRGWRTQVGS